MAAARDRRLSLSPYSAATSPLTFMAPPPSLAARTHASSPAAHQSSCATWPPPWIGLGESAPILAGRSRRSLAPAAGCVTGARSALGRHFKGRLGQ